MFPTDELGHSRWKITERANVFIVEVPPALTEEGRIFVALSSILMETGVAATHVRRA